MDALSPASDHDPVAILCGVPGRDALQLMYDVNDDSDVWIAALLRSLEEGAIVVIERSGDWLIFPS